MIVYKWTGEYRLPKKGEWHLEVMSSSHAGVICYPLEAAYDRDFCRWILDRQEIPDPAQEVDDGK